MSTENVARNYAKALFEVALERGDLAKVAAEVSSVVDLLERPEFKGFFEATQIGVEEKKQIFNRAFLKEISPIVRNFFWLIFDNRREGMLVEIQAEFEKLIKEYEKRATARLISAIPLSDKILSEIRDSLGKILNKQVTLESQVDPRIYGGFLIRVDNLLIDATIKTRLAELKEKLTQSR
jgi:F-type H+-transporting ATPase subunit delta